MMSLHLALWPNLCIHITQKKERERGEREEREREKKEGEVVYLNSGRGKRETGTRGTEEHL